ncbi:hypothetical protein [Burkholderia ubonensis]|uniref:hypothetical protein n=1 Tax=Burkholderia ubonensis TaxID=101571 RepID=UPI0012F71664|nr:hypothetical protein [Burkholderia ubonensis]
MTISAYIRVIDDMPKSSPAVLATRKTRAFSLPRLRFTVTRRHTAVPACDPHEVPRSPLDAPISAQRLARFTGGRPTFRRRPNHAIKGK